MWNCGVLNGDLIILVKLFLQGFILWPSAAVLVPVKTGKFKIKKRIYHLKLELED